MSNIRKSLLQFTFAGAYMKRWNDKLRPMELLEVDKQAHKMIVAWLLYQLNVEGRLQGERIKLGETIVEGGIFDYFFRLVITDIKPPIFYRIRENPTHYAQLISWVQGELEPVLAPLGNEFWERFVAYFAPNRKKTLGDEILDAAHLYASKWEFDLLKNLNGFDDEIPEIDASFNERLKAYSYLKGVPELLSGSDNVLGRLANLCGQLRFQKRWSQTPRVPETSVIGHMFLVACYSYFFSIVQDACGARRQNNFFCGLFHDLPELLTRDIISPVKKSVDKLDDFIKEYEAEELERRVLAPLRAEGYERLAWRLGYFLGLETGSEFDEAIVVDGSIKKLNFEQLQSHYNEDQFDPKDGVMLKACDTLAAFIEAYTAVRNGISVDELHQALWRLRQQHRKLVIGNIHVGALLADFD
ncbi:HD domain-containing protein [Desulfovibrio subterraneus]|uniref:Phosphohydrolase n=1 Tax=Desulfovibrio subterraneus TaxID=2718620 RepID=A0A7J0BGU8_9BACT|nr:HD domain-containing protein [Desulfovibrio subterraneus]GFM32906.1 phosphohydrolase [Desulfovibrio subterraneus]